MTAATKILTGAGFAGVQIALLGTNGAMYVDPTGATIYAGYRAVGAKALQFTTPGVQKVIQTGDDNVLARFIFAPQDTISGTLNTGARNLNVVAMVGGVSVVTDDERHHVILGTDQEDNLPDVMLLAYRQARDTDPASSSYGRKQYEYFLIPQAQVLPQMNSMQEGSAEQYPYAFDCNVVQQYPWAVAFAALTDGVTKGQVIYGVCEGVPRLISWEGDGTETVLTLDKDARSTDKMHVYSGGEEVTTGIEKAVGTVTWDTALADGTAAYVFYELADSEV